jgi:hypothetical protein
MDAKALVKNIRKELKSNTMRFLIVTVCVAALGIYLRDQTVLNIAYVFAFVTFCAAGYEMYKDPEFQKWLEKIRTHDEGDD